ncbi:MAG: hypothetical protein VB876_17495, partial [Pirellulales bacterium]
MSDNASKITRRDILHGTAAAAGAICLAGSAAAADTKKKSGKKTAEALKGNINHSIVQWCFSEHWDVERTCQIGKQLGCKSVELIGPDDWPTLKKYDMACAIAPSHLFMQGMNNPKYHGPCIELIKQRIDDCADAGFKTVISFTGYAAETGEWADGKNPAPEKLPKKPRVISPDEGVKNCVAGFKKV